ncbi:uncharacterized protein LOC115307424 [Manacus vitellinus]|uniref:uncharacterized protein LOC115307424 n=1 Tax=Manacus vitellinus TaxID=328815 RepID=UPI00115F5545|nr:uncharacterized protein LOC115307424 [Manacus vitellinus]
MASTWDNKRSAQDGDEQDPAERSPPPVWGQRGRGAPFPAEPRGTTAHRGGGGAPHSAAPRSPGPGSTGSAAAPRALPRERSCSREGCPPASPTELPSAEFPAGSSREGKTRVSATTFLLLTNFGGRRGINANWDLEIVYSYLHGMEALSNLREHQLRMMCETVRYERHEANEVLYYPDDIGSCWYILLSGSVFIKESMFLPRSSFGKRSAGSMRRGCECIVLEPSEMIVVDYMEESEAYFQRQASHRQSRRRFRKINQKGERQTIIDTVDPYPVGKPPLPRGYHTATSFFRTKPLFKAT